MTGERRRRRPARCPSCDGSCVVVVKLPSGALSTRWCLCAAARALKSQGKERA